jgi:MerC mercury resistance protein
MLAPRKKEFVRPTDSRPHARAEDWLERIAVGASLLCLAHCIALPLIIAALPILSVVLAIPETFHLVMLLIAIPFSGVALFIGRGHHARGWPLLVRTAGLALLAIAIFFYGNTAWEAPLTVLGSLFLAAAHLFNWRFRHARHID